MYLSQPQPLAIYLPTQNCEGLALSPSSQDICRGEFHLPENLTFPQIRLRPPRPRLLLLPCPASLTLFPVSPEHFLYKSHGWGCYPSEKPSLRQYAVLNRRENAKHGDGLSETAQGSKFTHRTVLHRNAIC